MTDAGTAVTVVVPTHRRPEGLARALTALADQVDPDVPWDVLVVDNAPPTAHAVLDGVPLPVPARVVDEPRQGAAHARNCGMHEATGRWIAYLDDDVTPEPDWLRELVAPLLAGRADVTAGRVVLDQDAPRPPWWNRDWMDSYVAAYARGDDEVELADDDFLLTANTCLDRRLLLRAGGFDPALGPRGGTQLVNDAIQPFRRIRAAGGRVRYVPSAVTVHELAANRTRRRWLARRLYLQGRSDWRLERGEPDATRGSVVRHALALARADVRALGPVWRWRRAYCYRATAVALRAAGVLRESLTDRRGTDDRTDVGT